LTDRLKDLLVLISAVPLGAVGVAQIAVALSLINFLNFAINAVETSFSPKTARSLTRDLRDGVAPREMQRANHFIAVTGVLKMAMVSAAVFVLWLFLPLIVRLFGPDYAAAAPATWCFIFIPAANAFFGNTSLVMQIFDQRMEFFLTSLLALAALPLVGIYGVPAVIAQGVDPLIATAAAFALTMVALQALRWILCLWRTGIDASFVGALIRRQQLKKDSR
jgi:O-antigen/teichoic acid export membrane protein